MRRFPGHQQNGVSMLDAILIAAGLAFFVVAILYEVACERL